MLDEGETHGTLMGQSWETPGGASSLRRTSKNKPNLLKKGGKRLGDGAHSAAGSMKDPGYWFFRECESELLGGDEGEADWR